MPLDAIGAGERANISLMRNYKVKATYGVGIAHINYSLVSAMDTFCAQ